MLVIALALFAAQQVAPPSADYVPDTGWRDNEWGQTFYERWFGNQLRAMREPALASVTDLGGFRDRFRLLVLPTFEPAYAYRVDVREDGAASLRWVRLNGRGGYAPGALARQGTRQLRRDEVSQFGLALRSAEMGSLQRQEHEGISDNPDGSQSLTMCLDGTTYVFEHLSSQGRLFIVRSCGIDEEPLDRLAEVVFRLGSRRTMN